jgi:hypothetical protein
VQEVAQEQEQGQKVARVVFPSPLQVQEVAQEQMQEVAQEVSL